MTTGWTRRDFLSRGARSAALIGASGAALPLVRGSATTDPVPDVAAATVLGSGLVASIRATGPAQVMLEAWPSSDPSAVQRTSWVPTNASNAAKLTLAAAPTPGTSWNWRGMVQPMSGSGTPVADVTRTLPPLPAAGAPVQFTFAFGACAVQNQIAETLQVVAGSRPQFFAFIGDMGYLDNATHFPNVQNYAGYSTLFRNFLARPDLAAVLAEAPLYGVQDDHDYGLNDCWGANYKTYAAQAYADLIPGAAYPDVPYRTWTVGDVDFFLTDNRRYSDGPKPPYENGHWRSLLGSAQRTWLLNGLATSTARLKVVFIPMTMAWYWSTGERDTVLSWIASDVSGTVVLLSGDKHAGGFARYSDRVWEMLACPLDNPVKHYTPPRQYVVWTENGAARSLYNAVGMVDVDTQTAGTVTLRLVRDDGSELYRQVVPVP